MSFVVIFSYSFKRICHSMKKTEYLSRHLQLNLLEIYYFSEEYQWTTKEGNLFLVFTVQVANIQTNILKKKIKEGVQSSWTVLITDKLSCILSDS